MALTTSSVAHRPSAEPVPRGYVTLAPVRDLVVPLILLYMILLPAGLALDVSGAVIPPYRMATLVLAPLAIRRMLQFKMSLTLADTLVIAGSVWALAAMLMTSPTIIEGLEGGGSFVIDTLGCYLVGRIYLNDVRKLRTFLIYALPGVLLIGVILAIESISGRLLIAPFFPQRASMEDLYELRLGFFLRGRATFPHSIAAGMFMGSLLSLYFLSRIRPLYKWLGVAAALMAIFSVSSSAFLMLLMLTFLIAYRSFFTQLLRTRERLVFLVLAAVFVYLFLDLATGRGAIRTIINYATLNPRTGYYRLLIWEYGSASVANDPWFGIGNAPMPRPDWMVMETIDNHWLMLAVRYGLPTAVLHGLGVFVAMFMCVSGNARLNDFDRATTMGALFALIALSLIAFTGALWGNHIAWYMMLAGMVSGLATQLVKGAPRPVRMKTARPVLARRSA